MSELTIVSAFFDIGRGGFKTHTRSNAVYLEAFAFWARMQNTLIVYTDEMTADAVMDIRSKYGLASRTHVVIIDNIYDLDRDIYERMTAVAESQSFIDFRLVRGAMSSRADYAYLMLLKTWFIADAVDRGFGLDHLAWLDFGFNRSGALYSHSEDFDYLWAFDFTDHVHLFHLDRQEVRPVFEMVRLSADYAMGAPLIVPKGLARRLWEINRECMVTLTQVGLIDDDQLVQFMSARIYPELFELHASDWFWPLKEYGGGHLRVRSEGDDGRSRLRALLARAVRGLRGRRLAALSAIRLYRNSVSPRHVQ